MNATRTVSFGLCAGNRAAAPAAATGTRRKFRRETSKSLMSNHCMMTGMPELALGRIGQIALTVRNAESSVPFYRDVLGLKLLFQFPNLAFFDCDGIRLMLSSTPEPETFSSVVYFKVDDIQAAHQELVARGAAFEHEPRLIAKMPDHDLWMAFLRDPDRNVLGLMCEVRTSAAAE
jgi:methylmalonyl-CoA/ethylmalonyl-CoA epimerase